MCTLTGTFTIQDLLRRARCGVKFTVKFDVDEGGVLTVHAKVHGDDANNNERRDKFVTP